MLALLSSFALKERPRCLCSGRFLAIRACALFPVPGHLPSCLRVGSLSLRVVTASVRASDSFCLHVTPPATGSPAQPEVRRRPYFPKSFLPLCLVDGDVKGWRWVAFNFLGDRKRQGKGLCSSSRRRKRQEHSPCVGATGWKRPLWVSTALQGRGRGVGGKGLPFTARASISPCPGAAESLSVFRSSLRGPAGPEH